MTKWMKRVGLVVLVAVIAVSAVGTAAAQGPDDRPGLQGPRGHIPARMLAALTSTAAEAMDTTPREMLAQLEDGQSLAELLEANGVDPQTVLDDALATIAAEIEQAVADEQITADQGERLLAAATNGLERAMTAPRPHLPDMLPDSDARLVRELLQVLRETTDLELADLVQAARDDQTLAAVLGAAGIDVNEITALTLAHIEEHLAAQVEAGRLTQEQVDTMLAEAAAALPEALNQPIDLRLFPDRPTPFHDRALEAVDSTLVGVLAEAAGMEPGELVRDAFAPPSLAEVAASYGLDPDALISTAEARIIEAVNEALAEGRITDDQAAQVLAGLRERLEQRFNEPFRPVRQVGQSARGMRGDGGPRR